MLNNFFNKPLELKIGDQTLRFNSVSDIAFCLEGRTSISSAKLSELFKLSIEQLETQSNKLTEINKSLFKILNRVVDDPDNIDRSMRELDTQIFSQDQNWRDIVQALNKEQGEIDSIRMTVIMKYMKYLSALEETIDYILSEKKQSIGAPVDDNEKIPGEFDATWTLNQLRSEIGLDSQSEHEFKRLPKGKDVPVKLSPGGRLDIRLASYPCQLVATDDNVQFIDNAGSTTLSQGRNIIGRSTKSTVKVNPAYKEVSRTHLQILIGDDHTLQLTDLSSEGTFITSEFLP
jgi:FHA domain